jgi:hypothetical protein
VVSPCLKNGSYAAPGVREPRFYTPNGGNSSVKGTLQLCVLEVSGVIRNSGLPCRPQLHTCRERIDLGPGMRQLKRQQ